MNLVNIAAVIAGIMFIWGAVLHAFLALGLTGPHLSGLRNGVIMGVTVGVTVAICYAICIAFKLIDRFLEEKRPSSGKR